MLIVIGLRELALSCGRPVYINSQMFRGCIDKHTHPKFKDRSRRPSLTNPKKLSLVLR